MNSQFHTPSLGDGFDLSSIEETATNTIDFATSTGFQHLQTDQIESKRMQAMEQNLPLTNVDLSNYPIPNTNIEMGINNSNTSGIFNITGHLNNNPYNGSTTNNQSHQPPATMAARKQLSPSATDSNEPVKPLSPYTFFFRDTISAIKQQNPNCAFTDLTRIVSSMWETLEPAQKDIYNKKTEAALNEYLKQLRIYKQQQHENEDQISTNSMNNETPSNSINANNYAQEQFSEDQSNLGSTVALTLSSSDNEAPATFQPTNNLPPSTNDVAKNSQMTVGSAQDTVPPQQISTEKDSAVSELCIRDGCNRPAIMNPDWEDEYCSNECVVIHCRNVFNDWVQQNKEAASMQK